MRLIKANDMKQMPWKNDGGVTSEVAISPPSAQVSTLDFDWRVSIATVASDGPFSSFPGYDRHLAVWSGSGLLLNGVERLSMQTFAFRGEEKIEAKLISEPVKDFGLIVKRDRSHGLMDGYALDEDETLDVTAKGDTFILCARGELRIEEFYLNPGDVIHVTGSRVIKIKALDRSNLLVANVWPRVS